MCVCGVCVCGVCVYVCVGVCVCGCMPPNNAINNTTPYRGALCTCVGPSMTWWRQRRKRERLTSTWPRSMRMVGIAVCLTF